MMFRNCTAYHVPVAIVAANGFRTALEQRVERHALRACGALEMQTVGWVSPFGDGHALVHPFGPFLLLALGSETKLLPGATVTAEVGKRTAVLEEQRGKRVGGRERKRIRDEVLYDLVPRALVKPGRTLAYLDTERGLLLVDTASRKAAEAVVTLLRETLGSLPALPLDPEESPRAMLTGWLNGNGDGMPDAFELGDECELRDPVDGGAVARCQRQALDTDEVREHLRGGKQVARLSLVHAGRVSTTLDETLVLRKVRFLDVCVAELEATERDSPQAELDARFALNALTLRPLLDALFEAFGCKAPARARAGA